jgi:DNA repair exonuclease SbcCD ATPase subunit
METMYDILELVVAMLIGGLAGLVTTLRRQNRELKASCQEIIEAESRLRQLYEVEREAYEKQADALGDLVRDCTKLLREKDEIIITLKDRLERVGQLHDN